MGVTDLNDPVEQIYGGAKYLAQALNAERTPEDALRWYHGGPNWRNAYGPESRAYVPKVTAHFQRIASQGGVQPMATQSAPRTRQSGAEMSDEDFLAQTAGGPPAASGAPSRPMPARAISSNPGNVGAMWVDRSGQQRRGTAAELDAAIKSGDMYRPPSTVPASGTGTSVAAVPPGEEDDEAFMARTGAAQPSKPPPQRAVNIPAPTADPFGNPLPGVIAETMQPGDALNLPAIAARANEAVSPAAVRTMLAPAPNTTYGDVLPIAKDNTTGELRPALPMGIRHLAQGAYDLVNGPATGTVSPEASMALFGASLGGGTPASVARGTGEAIANRLFGTGRREIPPELEPALRTAAAIQQGGVEALLGRPRNPLAPRPVAEGVPIGEPAPFPPAGMGVPPGVGAAAPPRSPAANRLGEAFQQGIPTSMPRAPLLPIVSQSAADRRAQAIIDHFGAGGPVQPGPELVPGSRPTLAQATGNAGIAALERGLQSSNPEFMNLATQRAAANGDARATALLNVTGTSQDIAAQEVARDVATRAARDAAFANRTPVNPQPVVESIQAILAGPEGKRDAVQRSLTPLLDKLRTADGTTLESDPAQLYGVRKAINDLLASKGTQEAADARAATRQLLDVKSGLDKVIESGAPGFQAYIEQYSALSRPIDGMRYLQGLNLTNAKGELQLGNIDRAIKMLEKQQSLPGARQADSVTADQLQSLRYIRDDLRQVAVADSAKPVGSTTVQNLATNGLIAGLAGGTDGGMAALGVGSVLAGSVNPYLLPLAGARFGMSRMNARGESLVRRSLTNRLFNPDLPPGPPPSFAPPP